MFPSSPSDFAAPASLSDRMDATRRLLTENFAEIIRGMPADRPVEIFQPLGARMFVIRDPQALHQLASCPALDRGLSHEIVHKIFGPKTVFLLPDGEEHTAKKDELRNHFGRGRVSRMTPDIAAAAADTVDSILAEPAGRVDMDDQVLRYLFRVGGQAVCGMPVDLGADSKSFQAGVETIVSTASSTVRLAFATVSRVMGHLLSWSARSAAQAMFGIGRTLIRAGVANPRDNLVKDMLRRHGIDPAGFDENMPLPQELLYDVSMTFAATIFTTSSLITGVIDHYQRNPAELAQLRENIARDFPDGVRGLRALPGNATMRQLMPVMMRHSPVDLAVRDVVAPHAFSDGQGNRYALRKGDSVAFDFATIQHKLLDAQRERLAATADTAVLTDFFDTRNNDVTVAFFDGVFQCPGRFLAMTDSALFLAEALARIDGCWEDPGRSRRLGLVNSLGGSPMMTVCPVRRQLQESLHESLHQRLHVANPSDLAAPQEPAPSGADRPAAPHACPVLAPRLHPLGF